MQATLSQTIALQDDNLPSKITLTAEFHHAAGRIDPDAIWRAIGRHFVGDGPKPPTVQLLGSSWRAPPLHGKALKTVHRAIAAIDSSGGRGVTIQDLNEKTGISLPPLYKMINPEEETGEYASKFLRVTKIGRTQVIDLTSEGRHLASLVRAGKVPA